MTRVAVTVLSRAPVPGQAKTRLAASIGAVQASAVASALALDVVESLSAWARSHAHGATVVLALTGDADAAASHARDALAIAPDLRVEDQAGGDLGCRMRACLSGRLAEGAKASVVVGSDCPDVASRLDAVVEALSRSDAVLVPALDGGFVLLGVAREIPEGALRGVPWGTSQALEATRVALATVGFSVEAGLPPLEDVDDLPGLSALGLRLKRGAFEAPRIGAWLRAEGYLR